MIVCPSCGQPNPDNNAYCEMCGDSLYQPLQLAAEEEQAWLDSLTDDTSYDFRWVDDVMWLLIQPETFYLHRDRLADGRLILGRAESTSRHTTMKFEFPFVNKLGVSRFHAALIPLEYGVRVQDIGSTNGTRLNRQVISPGRNYNLNHNDCLELGKLELHVHFVAQDKFVKAIRERLMAKFAVPVQEFLHDMTISTEAISVLLYRLPQQTQEQLQILNLFKERGEPVTLEHLHKRIDKVVTSATGPLVQMLDQSVWRDPPTGVIDQENLPSKKSSAASLPDPNDPSLPHNQLLAQIHTDGVKIEECLQAYLDNARQFPDSEMAQDIINVLIPMLIQLHTWLPTVDPKKHSQS